MNAKLTSKEASKIVSSEVKSELKENYLFTSIHNVSVAAN